ncbi:MAG: protein kinase [Ignavibacteriaceae bacterium]
MIGETILHYKIIGKLGEGGMGEVFKAQDTKLDRFVALKFLPSNLTTNEEQKARFIQEAKTASAMNHPNICTIYSIEEYDNDKGEKQLFIAMEYVEGETLKDKKDSLSEKQKLEISVQVAEGLAAAHEKGIVHRDIKPENIMIRKDGIAQIMDFGLAKLYADKNASRLTKLGTTVGTLGYMSPEQVQGLDVDHRTDIFSFGVVLYEMFAGESPFKGMHETAIMYEIVNVDVPPLSTIKNEIDPELDRIILECLEKDKDERCQSAKELAKDLRKVKKSSSQRKSRVYNVNSQAYNSSAQTSSINVSGATTLRDIPVKSFFSSIFYNPKLAWSFGILFFLTAVLMLVFFVFNKTEVEVQELKASVIPPHGINYDNSFGSNLTISPDGKYISFIGTDSSGVSKLWVRPVNSLTSRPLTAATTQAYPFWSPDSKSIAYFDNGKLMKISLDAGTSLPICDITTGRGGSWSKNGTIILSPNSTGGIFKVPSSGGQPEAIVKADTSNKNQSLRWEYFLPDGDHFLYSTENSTTGSSSPDAIYLSSLSDTNSKKIISASSNCQYANGYLLFVRQGILLAQRFDPDKLEIEGEAMPITENIQYYDLRVVGTFAVSKNGKLVYLTANQENVSTVLLDKDGKEIKKLLDQKPMYLINFAPDVNKLAYDLYDQNDKNISIWTYDLTRNVSTRLTFDKEPDIVPLWTKDGKSIIYSHSTNNGVFDSYIKNSDGSGDEKLLFKSNYTKAAVDISPDGNYILYQANNSTGNASGWDIILLDLKNPEKPVGLLTTNYNETMAKFSPNMKWIAYASDESGKKQIYVIPFNPDNTNPNASGKWQISVDGGNIPKWMNNGKSIYILTVDNSIMAVDVNEKGSTLSPGKPYSIFKPGNTNITSLYDINKSGTEIIATVPNGNNNSASLTLVANWQQGLEGKK